MSEEYSSHTLLVEKFKSDYLLQKFYYRHSDIDIYVNIIITELLNYNLLLSEEAKNFLQENFVNNYKYWNEIMSQKQQALDKTVVYKEINGMVVRLRTDDVDIEQFFLNNDYKSRFL